MDHKDHIVPRIHGGPDAQWNLVPTCAECTGMLSHYLPAKSGDTIGMIRHKKRLFLLACREALRKTPRWRRLSRVERWDAVRRGTWINLLPKALESKYLGGLQTAGHLVTKGGALRWKSQSRK